MNIEKMGKFIAQARNEKGLTQKELGAKLGIGDKSISKWERGINAPDISLLQKICEELDISLNDLLNGEKDSSKNDTQIDAIKFYSLKGKNKIITSFIIIILLLIIIFTYIYDISNYKKFEMYNTKSMSEEFNINGFIVLNKKRNIIFINNIEYTDKLEGTDEEVLIDNLDIYLYSNDKIIYSYKYDLFEQNDKMSLNEILNKSFIYVNEVADKNENINVNKLDNLILKIKYQYEDKEIEEVIPLKIEK